MVMSTKRVSWIFYIHDLRPGQFSALPILSQCEKCHLPLFASLSIQCIKNVSQYPIVHSDEVLTSDLCNMHLRSYDVIRGHEQLFGSNFCLG